MRLIRDFLLDIPVLLPFQKAYQVAIPACDNNVPAGPVRNISKSAVEALLCLGHGPTCNVPISSSSKAVIIRL